jgi:hypothetical protein
MFNIFSSSVKVSFFLSECFFKIPSSRLLFLFVISFEKWSEQHLQGQCVTTACYPDLRGRSLWDGNLSQLALPP